MNSSLSATSHLSATISIGLLAAASLVIVFVSARRTKSISTFYAAGRSIGAWQNAFALAGDFVGAGGFLALTGLIALYGADGLVYAIGVIAAWPLMLFLFAEPVRQLGKYTLADLLFTRLRDQRIRPVIAIIQLIIVLTSLTGQLVGAMAILRLLLGLSGVASLVLIAAVLMGFVMIGGMLATTWLEVFKALLMLALSTILVLLVLGHVHFNPLNLTKQGLQLHGTAVLVPGALYQGPWELISVVLGMALGGCSMPHVLMRMNTVTDARAGRRSVLISTGIIVVFHLTLLILGFGAMVLVGSDVIRGADKGGNMALPLLAKTVGGDVLLGVLSAVALATILAVVAGLSVAGSAALSHDLWNNTFRRQQASEREKLLVGRTASMLLIISATLGAYVFQNQNIGFVSALANAVAAAAVFPALLLTIFWRRFNGAGALTALITGSMLSLLSIYFGPLIQIGILKHQHAAFPLQNPAIVTVPLTILITWVVSLKTSGNRRLSG